MFVKVTKPLLAILMLLAVDLNAESLYGFGTEEAGDITTRSMPLNTISALRQKILSQEERIDGLTTIIEGLSATLNELQSQNMQQNSANTQGNEALLEKLAGMIDEINANYVSRSELNELLATNSVVKKKEVNSKKNSQKETTKNSISLEGKSNKTLYSEAVRHFVKKHYDEAKKRFSITDIKGYKPAASNYYLGEIAYYSKQYEDAIFYFKKSAGLYDKASYIDTLLLHTAIALDKTNQKSQARVFYENIIENYPTKKTAKIARDRLKKL